MPTLYLIVCAAGAARHTADLVRAARSDGWSVHCIATPAAVEHFIDLAELESATGHEVRTAHRNPGDPPLPPADAVLVAPATYNTVNKWAAGIGDTYVLIKLAELTGLGVPIVVVPYVNSVLAANRVFHRSLAELRESGIRVLYEPEGESFPWQAALAAVLQCSRKTLHRVQEFPSTPPGGEATFVSEVGEALRPRVRAETWDR